MTYTLKFKDDCVPLNGTEVLCLLQDSVSGKKKIISAFYDNGVYWDSASSHGEGIEGYMKNTDGTFMYNWVVVGWCLNSFGG